MHHVKGDHEIPYPICSMQFKGTDIRASYVPCKSQARNSMPTIFVGPFGHVKFGPRVLNKSMGAQNPVPLLVSTVCIVQNSTHPYTKYINIANAISTRSQNRYKRSQWRYFTWAALILF